MNYKIKRLTCFYHETRKAVNICAKCGAPICEEDSVKVLVTKIVDEPDSSLMFYHKTFCLICHMEYKATNKSAYTKRRMLVKFIFGLPFIIGGFGILYMFSGLLIKELGKYGPLATYLTRIIIILPFFMIPIVFIVVPAYLLYYIEIEARYGVYRKTRPLTYEDEMIRQIIEEKNLQHLLNE